MAARRKADQLIVSGQVLVNGVPAVAGQQVTAGVDRVTIGGRAIEPVSESTYLMMNKPIGVLTSIGDDRGRQTVADHLPSGAGRVFPVGRLDLNSRGLVLLTDDGELAGRLMHPRYHVEKEYRVVIQGRPGDDALRRLSQGMVIRGEQFQPAEVRVRETTPEESQVTMVLREGRKREVRRLWQMLGHPVLDLQRVRIDGLQLGDLEEGTVRALRVDEVLSLKAAVNLP
ncbi:MAG: rRNA pseudouridine synthase [Chloroflexi bacterium]|nr:MAG: rRNA pseudouridine synthase [Chloroflexota bacterium]TMF48832.1 MAG: rRNA pseudouridine synthase [Chloroflexota bacterium]TMG16609.1 MAG: rRNA pseudouridine synthase [Chloroflexota bacterium]TMG17079.1 MAG: rRNA pseudouridine synthase [Chloroflexota bacterium]TMG49308.1 MAG: rRNA pseudouridine synthase [Chloroflexota bacterium]